MSESEEPCPDSFTCPHCGRRFWVLENAGDLSEWERLMPPPFCPGCGLSAAPLTKRRPII